MKKKYCPPKKSDAKPKGKLWSKAKPPKSGKTDNPPAASSPPSFY